MCANVEFPFPGRLVTGALAAATGIDPADDPWPPERSVWPLLGVVDECVDQPWLATLARHLEGARGEPGEPTRRFATVSHIAGLFDRYGVHRPEMVRGWVEGAGQEWQPELWRRLRAHIGSPSPAERLTPACRRIREQPELLDLPSRLALFGLTRMPRSYLDVLAAISEQRDVHLFLLHPSPSLWRRVSDAPLVRRRREDPTIEMPANRLLASWGRDSRELQLVVSAAGDAVDHLHGLPVDEARTVLARLQAEIRDDRQGEPLGEPDDSVQIHACHGRARQVEVLRDAILHLLAEDPTLEPRDVIVMCPDIESFAPLIQATFGAGRAPEEPDRSGLPDLRVRLADRSLRQTNPVLTVVAQLLELGDQRATASQLLDLASREPVRRRFGFDDDDIARIRDWVSDSGIRWGFDREDREAYGLGGLRSNTWRKGVDRVLAGVAMTEDGNRLINGTLPLDDVESGAIELAGRFAEYVDRVRAAADALGYGKPIEAWVTAIGQAADSLTATSERDAWQRRELQRILDDITAESAAAPPGLELGDVRALLADRLQGRPTRANFRTGHLTVCTLVPMRSVPHRVVCILGLDDGEFPRRARRDGDDLLLADPYVGDRDPRSEDRQLLLDALMAATERLIITYTGSDERTNLRRPPAVPVGELLDAIDRTARGPARDQVVICHPLQAFDPRNFTAGSLVEDRPWGFDRRSLAGALALAGPRSGPSAFLPAPLPPLSEPVLELERLVRFIERPVRALLRDRLQVNPTDYLDEVHDAIPVELDGLERWQIGQRLLDGVLAGVEMDACLRAEQQRGSLPPGRLAIPVLERIRSDVGQIAEHAVAFGSGSPVSLDVNLVLPDGRTLAGTVTGVHGDTLRIVSYSRVRPRDRLRAWVRLLAMTAAWPERSFEAVVIGRARADAAHADVTVVRTPPLGADAALGRLAILLDLYDRGMREPLPLACDTSAAYAAAVATGQDGVVAARRAWESDFDRDREDREPEHVLAFGGELALAELMAEPPREDERGPGWPQAETSRFGRYALRLWEGLLGAEEFSDR